VSTTKRHRRKSSSNTVNHDPTLVRRTRSKSRLSPSPSPDQSTQTHGSVINSQKSTKAAPRNGQIIDGWLVGSSPKIDASPAFDFGGTPGVVALMIGFPSLMYYMWLGATYFDGKLPARSDASQSLSSFVLELVNLCYVGAFPSLKAWGIYWTFFSMQCFFYLHLPGVYAKGKPLAHENGKQLTYYCSAVWSFYTTIAISLFLHVTGWFKLYTLIDEFGPLMSVAIITGFALSFVTYFRAIINGSEHRMTGHKIYDFFMGAELNPRLFGWLDFKMFYEVRIPWFMLFFVTLGVAARQYERYGYVSGEVLFLVMAHWLYANACCKGEELIVATWYVSPAPFLLTYLSCPSHFPSLHLYYRRSLASLLYDIITNETMFNRDMYYEKLGFMLTFWNLAGVPLSYCHCSIYLANHHPSTYSHSKPVLFLFFSTYLFVYWIWDTCNSQKNMFRAIERGYEVHRKTFPQLPWKVVKNPKKIETQTGDPILCDGWYGYARKVSPFYSYVSELRFD